MESKRFKKTKINEQENYCNGGYETTKALNNQILLLEFNIQPHTYQCSINSC